MKVYLSGAIKNDPNYETKFKAAKQKYQAKGYEVLSPIETVAHKTHQNSGKCLFDAIKAMEGADILIQLDDPQKSEGMQIEQRIADYCNITVIRE